MDAKTQAKRLLLHYFTLLAQRAGIRTWDGDNIMELESIVDLIVDAAVAEAKQQIELDQRRGYHLDI